MKIWLVSAEMGYGHLRAAYPFIKYAKNGKIISIGNDEFTSPKVKSRWQRIQKLYEFVTRNKDKNFVGKFFFKLLNEMLWIPNLYTSKDLSQVTFQVKTLYRYIKDGLYDDFIELIKDEKIPIISSFYAPTIAADYYGFDNNYCIVTDSDLNRVWVAANPKESKVKYFVSSYRAYHRLVKYGVDKKNIFVTGFPFNRDVFTDKAVKISIAKRLKLFAPENFYLKRLAKELLDFDYDNMERDDKLRITYAVGGAGAQKEIAKKILVSFKQDLLENKVIINLVAGSREDVVNYFNELVENYKLPNISILYNKDKMKYFEEFDKLILESDILWTKPSELSFYSALGIPLILSPSVGAQEKCNRVWLRDELGIGIVQNKPRYANIWIKEFIKSGRLAEVALLGYAKQNINGTDKILSIINNGKL